jgi:fatty-acid peroxygenase
VDTPLERIARHIDADGAPLPTGAAAQELINLLRPIVAVGRFITFALHAKHQLAEDTWREPGKLAPAELAAFVEEVRRVSPFFPLMGGRVLEPFAWNGTGFAEGDWLILDIYATHRHPEGWQAPERFAPERHLQPTPPGATLAQGHGDPAVTHACPGEPLTQHLMAEALRHFAEVRYAVAAQDLSIPLTTFATGPRDGMVIIPRPEAEEAAAAAPS